MARPAGGPPSAPPIPANGTDAATRDYAALYEAERAARCAAEERLRESEALNGRLQWAVAETHHRVKNNLQVISAMIDVQSAGYAEAIPAHEIRRLAQHVRGLASIHDLLAEHSRAGDAGGNVSARAALHKLLPTMEASISGKHLRADVVDVELSSRRATALGIIATELVSNAIKHAREQAELSLRVEAGVAELTVADDGKGFPPGFTPGDSARTGMDLVLMLARWDLSGQIAFGSRPDGGARVTVTFPVTLHAGDSPGR